MDSGDGGIWSACDVRDHHNRHTYPGRVSSLLYKLRPLNSTFLMTALKAHFLLSRHMYHDEIVCGIDQIHNVLEVHYIGSAKELMMIKDVSDGCTGALQVTSENCAILYALCLRENGFW